MRRPGNTNLFITSPSRPSSATMYCYLSLSLSLLPLDNDKLTSLYIYIYKTVLKWYDDYFKSDPLYGGKVVDGQQQWAILDPPPVNNVYVIYGIKYYSDAI